MAPPKSNPNRNPADPFASFRFKVVIDGIEAHFQSVSGLSATVEVVSQPEGGETTDVHQLKGKTTYSNIVLKRGVTTSRTFFSWISATINDPAAGRKNGSIELYAEDGSEPPKQTWNFVRAWPTKWEGGSFDTGSSAALIETLELAHEGLS